MVRPARPWPGRTATPAGCCCHCHFGDGPGCSRPAGRKARPRRLLGQHSQRAGPSQHAPGLRATGLSFGPRRRCLRRGFVTRGLRRLCHKWGGWLFRSHLRTSSNCLRTSSSAGRKGVLKIEPQADSRSAVPAQSRTATLVARSTRLALVSRECRPSSTGAWGDLAEPQSLHPTPSSQGQGSASPRARQRRPCPPRPSCAQ